MGEDRRERENGKRLIGENKKGNKEWGVVDGEGKGKKQ